jgi:hypothetical protein
MVDGRLRRPTDREAAMDMGLRPIEQVGQFSPITHVLKG